MTTKDDTIRHYEAQGNVIIPKFLDEQDLCAIEDEIAGLGRRDPASFTEGHFFHAQDGKTINQIEHLQRYSRFFERMMREDRRILKLVEAIFGAEAVCDNVSYMAKPARVGAVVPWHQDNAYYGFAPDDALSVWIALDPCDEGNGCMRVVPGSHKKGLRPHGPTGVRGISYGLAETIESNAEVNLELQRGDASLHHCAMFHASHANRSDRSRRSVILFYHSARCTIDQSILDDYAAARDRMIAEAEGS